MKDRWFRLMVAWHRLMGANQVQAEWRARRALERADEDKGEARTTAARVVDRRYNCLCGQLLTADMKTCPACGRRQWLPMPLRRGLRALGLVVPEAAGGMLLVVALILAGFAVQLRVGGGGLWAPTDTRTALALGSFWFPLMEDHQYWRSITYAFLHGGIIHLGFNLFALSQVGPLVERRFGTGRFLFAFVLTSMAAVLVPPLFGFARQAPILGASGGLFGIIGMAMLWGHRSGTTEGRIIRDIMVRWTVYTTLLGFAMGGIAHSAHFGGLAAGALVALLLPPAEGRPRLKALGLPLGLIGVGLVGWSLWQFWFWWSNYGVRV